MAATTDGFELSRVDLEQRREGDVLGRSQSGFRSSLQNLRVLRDEETIVAAREAADGAARRAIRTSPGARGSPRRWQSWSSHGSLTSWRSHERLDVAASIPP